MSNSTRNETEYLCGAEKAVVVTTAGSTAVTGVAWVPGSSLLLSCASGGQLQAWELSPSGETLKSAPPPVPLSKAVCGGIALGLAVSGNGAFVAVVRAGTIAQMESNKCVSFVCSCLPAACPSAHIGYPDVRYLVAGCRKEYESIRHTEGTVQLLRTDPNFSSSPSVNPNQF